MIVVGSAIQDKIIEEIQAAKFFSLLADEVTNCANLEQVSIVIRFVDRDKEIREEFLGFLTLERITGDSLSSTLLSWLQTHEIDITFCRGQGYDGASCMSSTMLVYRLRYAKLLLWLSILTVRATS